MDFSILFARLGMNPADFESEVVETVDVFGGFLYLAKQRVREAVCPSCGSRNVVRNGTYKTTVKCSINRNIKELLVIERPRMLCRDPRCGTTTFTPPLSGVRKGGTIPVSTVKLIAVDLRREMSFAQIARDYGVSTMTVLRVMDDVYGGIPRFPLTEEICVDEFNFGGSKAGSGEKYPAIVVDGATGRLLDVVRSRRADTLYRYFSSIPPEERKAVRVFNSDMYDAYRSVRRYYFKGAAHVIDPFHIVKQITSAINIERAKAYRNADEGSMAYRFQKAHWKVFLMRESEIPQKAYHYKGPDEEYAIGFSNAMEEILEAHPHISGMCDALQAMYKLIDGKAAKPASDELRWIVAKLRGSGSPEAAKVANTYEKWWPEITATFRMREEGAFHSNSPAEGMNNRIATLIKLSYGLADFERMRSRALLVYGLGARDELEDLRDETIMKILSKSTEKN
ncbi:MAG: ISL3 family transposase [Bacilli bacterium]|nr:ISL3 family transposase [Bacilli bacterium]